MDKSLMLIVNPVAGKGAYKLNFASAMQELAQDGYRVDLYFTAARGDATEFAAAHGAGYDVVACIGGDGTLSEVVSGLIRLDDPPPLGYFPMGTSNDIATSLELPKNNVLEAARRLIAGSPHPYDIGLFAEDEHFAYIAGFGAFTDVSYTTPQDQKNALGHLAYVLQGMARLPSIQSCHTRVEWDGGAYEGRLIYGSLSNSTSVAGIVHFKEHMVSLSDGLSELVLVKEPSALTDLADLAASVLSQSFDSDMLVIAHTRSARFLFEQPVAWTRDGEPGGLWQDVTLKNLHAPVQLIF